MADVPGRRDAAGKSLATQGHSIDRQADQTVYTAWMPDDTNSGRRGMPGAPTLLKLRVPTRVREIDIPVEFDTIPLDPRKPPFN